MEWMLIKMSIQKHKVSSQSFSVLSLFLLVVLEISRHMDRSSPSYLLATLAKDMATTVVVARSSKEEEEVGTNSCE